MVMKFMEEEVKVWVVNIQECCKKIIDLWLVVLEGYLLMEEVLNGFFEVVLFNFEVLNILWINFSNKGNFVVFLVVK